MPSERRGVGKNGAIDDVNSEISERPSLWLKDKPPEYCYFCICFPLPLRSPELSRRRLRSRFWQGASSLPESYLRRNPCSARDSVLVSQRRFSVSNCCHMARI